MVVSDVLPLALISPTAPASSTAYAITSRLGMLLRAFGQQKSNFASTDDPHTINCNRLRYPGKEHLNGQRGAPGECQQNLLIC